MTIRVIGAGFGRTGTASLKIALEGIGFGKCYHMREVMEHPAHAKIWDAAAQGHPVDWDALFSGYQATVDWPGCTFYQELMARYPEAKVILTVRDPEKWHVSAIQTIYRGTHAYPASVMRHIIPRLRTIFRMQDHVFWERTFHGRFADKAYAIDIFNRHNEEVRRYVPPERLLVYEVSQGWEPLCRFLNVPEPTDQPFPHVNDTASFQEAMARRYRAAQRTLTASLIVTGGLIVAGWRIRHKAHRAIIRSCDPCSPESGPASHVSSCQ